MRARLDPFSFLVISIAGWLNQRQQHVIEYLVEENRILRQQKKEFIDIIAGCGVDGVKLPAKSPNLNAYAERFVRTIKEDCLNRMLFFGEDMLRSAIREFVIHYHEERNHQALDNQLLTKPARNGDQRGRLRRRERIGGMLNYYFRDGGVMRDSGHYELLNRKFTANLRRERMALDYFASHSWRVISRC